MIVGEVELWGDWSSTSAATGRSTPDHALWVPLDLGSLGCADVVVTALAHRDALAAYGVPTGIIQTGTGLPIDADDLRRVFVPEPVPPMPLRPLMIDVARRCISAALFAAWCVVTLAVATTAFLVATSFALATPLVVGTRAAALGGDPVGWIAGGLSAIAIVGLYGLVADGLGLLDH